MTPFWGVVLYLCTESVPKVIVMTFLGLHICDWSLVVAIGFVGFLVGERVWTWVKSHMRYSGNGWD